MRASIHSSIGLSNGPTVGVRPLAQRPTKVPVSVASRRHARPAVVGLDEVVQKFRDDAARIWWQDGRQQKFVFRQAGTVPLDAFIDRFVAELVGRPN
jgi:hypothetical protein